MKNIIYKKFLLVVMIVFTVFSLTSCFHEKDREIVDREVSALFILPFTSSSYGNFYGLPSNHYVYKDATSSPIVVSIKYNVSNQVSYDGKSFSLNYETLKVEQQFVHGTAYATADSINYSNTFNITFVLPSYRIYLDKIFHKKFKQTTSVKWILGNNGMIGDSSEPNIDKYDVDLISFQTVSNGHNYTDKNYMFSTELKTLRYCEANYHKDLYGTHDSTLDVHYYNFATNTYTGSNYSKIEKQVELLLEIFNYYNDYEMLS